MTVLLSLNAMAVPDSKPKDSEERILFLHSYPLGERGLKLNEGFSNVIKNRFPKAKIAFDVLRYDDLLPVFVDFTWEKLKNNRSEVVKERMRLHKLIKEYNPSILVLSDDEVAEIVHPLPLSIKAPIFVMGMNRPLRQISWYKKNPERYVGGIEDEKPLIESLRFLRDLLPVKKIAIVTSNELSSSFFIGNTVEAFHEYSKKQVDKFGPGASLEVTKVIRSSKWKEWKTQLLEVQNKVDLVWMLIPYQVYDENGREKKVSSIGRWLVDNLKVPTVGISDINVKTGALFAQASDTEAVGRQLGEQVLGYLLNGKSKPIGFERRLGYDFFINRETAVRFGIDIPKKHLSRLNVIMTSKVREKKGTEE